MQRAVRWIEWPKVERDSVILCLLPLNPPKCMLHSLQGTKTIRHFLAITNCIFRYLHVRISLHRLLEFANFCNFALSTILAFTHYFPNHRHLAKLVDFSAISYVFNF